ncbi:hypothetical protein ACRRTK_018387 [Alexandromys fortis]
MRSDMSSRVQPVFSREIDDSLEQGSKSLVPLWRSFDSGYWECPTQQQRFVTCHARRRCRKAGLKAIGAAYWLTGLRRRRRRGKCVVIGGGRHRRGRGLYKRRVPFSAQAVGLSERRGRGAPRNWRSGGWRGREQRLRGVQGRRPHRFTFFAEPGADLERLQ